jgi:hypothetical protein
MDCYRPKSADYTGTLGARQPAKWAKPLAKNKKAPRAVSIRGAFKVLIMLEL